MEKSTFESLEEHEMVDLVSNDFETNLENFKSNEATVDEHLDACPSAGMEFESLEDVKKFYTSFAKKEGFGVRVRSTKQNFCMLVCSNEGKHIAKSENDEESNVCIGKKKKKKRCSTSRTDCKASLIVSKGWKRSKWVIKSITNVHNHGMVSPKSVTYLRCHKNISTTAKNLVEKFEEEGVATGKVATMFQDETEKSFEWLFKTWLEAMSGKYPVSIITDQDLAMKGAIAKG
ncbi:hypothetical protein TSUD_190630 [Trifolium subterraneum]|uniref:Uncharacterized protein n=1 Tax=Trifolium subterraneum TaxID=3900 RepID=A0A2Z6NT52_TRISU|nr:hypothetical protein TSUD_190630 [Trifolium subterraneum]